MSYQPLPGQGIKFPELSPTVMGIVFPSGDLPQISILKTHSPAFKNAKCCPVGRFPTKAYSLSLICWCYMLGHADHKKH